VVELDIAACYEYLDHSILADELLLRSMAPAVVDMLTAVLQDVSSRGRGLPRCLVPVITLRTPTYFALKNSSGR
jgi:RNA-directed DNA polymerase